ncbi:integrase catalytic domain-containing protein [Trichonephila clavipes]|nr:integrase catalytic domain-containing protein [Trichonephila clavipes]
MIRVFAWILRFVNNCRKDYNKCEEHELSVAEIENSEKQLIRLTQTYYLPDVDSLKLVTFIDNDNILRVKSKITERTDESSFLYPILLPDKWEFTKLLIRSIHKKNCHAGIQIMQSLIRERFWIIRARETIKSILNECFICARFKVKSLSSGPSPLPPDRVNDCSIFEVVGIDLAGPLFLKTGEKVWITLFICAVYRALHLELVNALSSDAFLLALRRFIARRGRPRIIYCDNGTNFRGAFNDLAKLDWHKISRETSTQKIVWKFIPPTAAWRRGWWERLVRIIKELLRRFLGKSILSYEELSTVICECEFLINSRPLTYISENPQELIPLTPAMFLIENRCSDTTDIDELNSRDLRKRMKYRIKLFRQRFRKEYLSELIQKQNDNRVREPRIGEMVLIGNGNKKRLSWPIAKIIELIPGRDGEIRTVRLKTQHGTVIRPVQRIFLLEVQAIANSDKELKEESISVKSTTPEKVLNTNDAIVKKYTSSGRLVKEPKRLDLLNYNCYMFETLPKSQRGEVKQSRAHSFPKKTARPIIPTKALEPLQTKNNFETLTPDPDPIIKMTTENIAPKPRAPHPITLKVSKNYRDQIKMINETFPDMQIKTAGDYFKLYPNTIDQSRSLTHFLESDSQFQFYTIPLLENKPLKVVIKGLPRVTLPEEITIDLEELGFTVTSCTQMISKCTKLELPFFLVTLPRNDFNLTIRQLTHLHYLKISVEGYSIRGVTQCYECNNFYHTAANCFMQPRCLNWGKDHMTKDCNITERVDNPYCINCHVYGHTACYTKCPRFLKPKSAPHDKQK